MKKSKNVRLLTAPEIKKNLERMGREILRENKASDSLAFIGIRTRGLFLAQRVRGMIKKSQYKEVPLGEMDIRKEKSTTRASRSTSTTKRSFSSMTCSTPGGRYERQWIT
jgi:pyrimidine operon attenuation protein/uracil phosphoribosyltransferase